MKIYVVRPGDSIWSISRAFGVSTQSIIKANGLIDTARLVIGQSLVIPSKEVSYRVQPGDTIWSIATDYIDSNTDIRKLVYEIREINKLNSAIIIPGQELLIPQE